MDRKRVILLIESSRAYGRGCLMGVASYARSHGPWTMLHLERGLTQDVPRIVREWNGDGIISRVENEKIAKAVNDCRLPTVDLRGLFPPKFGVMVDTDHQLVAEMGANHFLEIGFRHLAFCGFPGIEFSEKRCEAFQSYLGSRGYGVDVYKPPRRYAGAEADVIAREAMGELEGAYIAAWLKSLPRPLALLACNDVRGRHVLDVCEAHGINVPEEVAVLGVDDDAVICELCHPPLSSIEPDTLRIGYEGAALLAQMMEGEMPTEPLLLIPPRAARRRLSSEATATDDREVAAAMQFIRDQACQGANVQDVIKALAISRSTLERRFLRAFGRSPASEIERVRMARARLLLSETSYKLARIALSSGYKTAAQFVTAFKRCHGQTPGQFREQEARDNTQSPAKGIVRRP